MMNRKEFKKLLIEWNQNFINERTSPEFEETLQDLLSQKGVDKKLSKFDIVHVAAKLTDELDEIRLEEISKFPEAIQPDSIAESVAFVNNDKNRKSILNYLLDKEAITQSEVNRVNEEGKSRDIMIIFTSGDVDGFDDNIDTTYNDAIFNLHDTFHSIFDFNFPNRIEGHLDSSSFNDYLIDELSGEDLDFLVEYINEKLSAIDYRKYQPHDIDLSDFYASFMVFIYLFILSPDASIENSVDNLFIDDNLEEQFENPIKAKDIIIKCANGLEQYAIQSANDPVKYIYIILI